MKKLFIFVTFLIFISPHLTATNKNDHEECVPEKSSDMKERQFSKEFVGTFNERSLLIEQASKKRFYMRKIIQTYRWLHFFIQNI